MCKRKLQIIEGIGGCGMSVKVSFVQVSPVSFKCLCFIPTDVSLGLKNLKEPYASTSRLEHIHGIQFFTN